MREKVLWEEIKQATKKIQEILLFGKSRKRVNHFGNLHGVLEDQDGILSAQQWQVKFLIIQLIFIREVLI